MSSEEARETVPPTATLIAGVTGGQDPFLKSDIFALFYVALWIFSHLIISRRHYLSLITA